jgi:integrase
VNRRLRTDGARRTELGESFLARGKSEADAAELVRQFSGHSMRAGYCTAAAGKDVPGPGYRIQQHTRHRSAEMVARYVREADKWNKSGLKGVGF